ncbi:MAG TPA: SpoIIE family protein phosphatase [Acidobacteriota bacterium]
MGDAFSIDPRRLLVQLVVDVGDVSGKGVPAALLMSKLQSAFPGVAVHAAVEAHTRGTPQFDDLTLLAVCLR